MFLIIDTSLPQALIGLADKNGITDSETWSDPQKLSLELLPRLDGLLAKNGLEPAQLSALVVMTGPGSYTGLRIGISTANALGFALKVPVLGVNQFELWSAKERLKSGEKIILDADHAKIFIRIKGEYKVGSPRRFKKTLLKTKAVYSNLGAVLKNEVKKINPAVRFKNINEKPQEKLAGLRRVALQSMSQGKSKDRSAKPLYIRPPSITPANPNK